jgi:uncharacterized protein YeaC (DUF1315 family)
MLTPGDMVANASQKDNILRAVMNGNYTTNNNATHHITINSPVTVMGSVDNRAVKDFALTRAQADKNLITQLRRVKMAGQAQGVFA